MVQYEAAPESLARLCYFCLLGEKSWEQVPVVLGPLKGVGPQMVSYPFEGPKLAAREREAHHPLYSQPWALGPYGEHSLVQKAVTAVSHPSELPSLVTGQSLSMTEALLVLADALSCRSARL
jgi:hypothetical protein